MVVMGEGGNRVRETVVVVMGADGEFSLRCKE